MSGGYLSGGICPVGICPVGICPDTDPTKFNFLKVAKNHKKQENSPLLWQQFFYFSV